MFEAAKEKQTGGLPTRLFCIEYLKEILLIGQFVKCSKTRVKRTTSRAGKHCDCEGLLLHAGLKCLRRNDLLRAKSIGSLNLRFSCRCKMKTVLANDGGGCLPSIP